MICETGLRRNNNTALVGYLEFSALIKALTCKFDYVKVCFAQ